MDTAAMAVLAGMSPLLFLPQLPSTSLWWLIACLTLWCALQPWRGSRWLALAGVAFLWASAQAAALLQQVDTYGDKKLTVSGIVRSIDIGQTGSRRVRLEVEQVEQQRVDHFSVSLIGWEPEQAVQ
ncbi:MAG: hypothetical protein ACRC5A_14990, partial [Enterobacteriaceae bacterium]